MATTSKTFNKKRKAVVISSDEEDVEDSPQVIASDRDSTVRKPARIEFPHSPEIHHIDVTAAQSIQHELTAWFSTVHDSRGMPWRRRWDPALSSDAKAQRAYEVCGNGHWRTLLNIYVIGMGIRNNATAN